MHYDTHEHSTQVGLQELIVEVKLCVCCAFT